MHGYYHEIENWLLSGVVNLGFLKLPVSEKIETFPLERERLVAILPMGHPLAALDVIPIERLTREKFILLEEGHNEEIQSIFVSSGFSPNIAYRTQDDYTIMSFVERGLGIGILPERVLTRSPYQVAVRPLEPPFFGLYEGITSGAGAAIYLQWGNERKQHHPVRYRSWYNVTTIRTDAVRIL